MSTPNISSTICISTESKKNYSCRIDHIHWYLNSSHSPQKFKHLGDLSFESLNGVWETRLSEEEKNKLIAGACNTLVILRTKFIYRPVLQLRPKESVDIDALPVEEQIEEVANALKELPQQVHKEAKEPIPSKPGERTFVYGLFNSTAAENEYAPEVWQVRKDFLADLESLGGASCPACRRNGLVAKYKSRLEAIVGGPVRLT